MNERLGFVYPGQGSQRVGMLKEFYHTRAVAREIIDQADRFLREWGWDYRLIDVLFSGPQEVLNNTKYAQPSLFTVEAATHKILLQEGINPDIVSGHSAGMYAAYFAAGVLSFEDGLKLTKKRGEIMADVGSVNPGKMAAVRSSIKDVDQYVKDSQLEEVYIANVNSPEQVVVSGRSESVEKLAEFLKQKDIGHRILRVSIASHSPLMHEAQAPFAVAVNSTQLHPPEIGIVLDTTGAFPHSPEEIRQHMVQQLVSRVLWVDAVRNMINQGVNSFVEVGPGNALSGLIQKIDPTVKTFQVFDEASLEKLTSVVS